MRICHIISGDLWAGAEVMFHRLLKGLLNYRDLALSAVLLNEGKIADEIRKLGIPLEIVDETRSGFLRIAGNFRDIMQRTSPDIIHSHRLKEDVLAFLSAGKAARPASLVCTYHGMDEPLSGKLRIKRKILSHAHQLILSRRFTHVVVVSEEMKSRFVREYGFPKEKVKVIHNGTCLPDDPPLKREDGTLVIGSAGRLFPVKDYPRLVEVAREVSKQANGILFELAGEGPEREKILGLVREYGLEEVFALRGFVDDMASFYRGLDVFVNTSLHEGFPMSVLEAMAHGIPVVAPNRGGLKELLVEGLHGYLVEGGDASTFADRCIRLCGDTDTRRKMGAAARERVAREFSSAIMAEKYYHMYSGISKSRGMERPETKATSDNPERNE